MEKIATARKTKQLRQNVLITSNEKKKARGTNGFDPTVIFFDVRWLPTKSTL